MAQAVLAAAQMEIRCSLAASRMRKRMKRLKMLGRILQKKETLKIQMEMKHYKKQSRMVYNKKKRSKVSQ